MQKGCETAPKAWQKITRGAVGESCRIQILAASAVAWDKTWKIIKKQTWQRTRRRAAHRACGCSSSSRTTQAAFLVHASCKHMYVATRSSWRPSQPIQSFLYIYLCAFLSDIVYQNLIQHSKIAKTSFNSNTRHIAAYIYTHTHVGMYVMYCTVL